MVELENRDGEADRLNSETRNPGSAVAKVPRNQGFCEVECHVSVTWEGERVKG